MLGFLGLVRKSQAAEPLVLRRRPFCDQHPQFLRQARSRRARRAHAQGVPSRRHADRPARQRLHLDLRHHRCAPRPHRRHREPQETPRLGSRRLGRADRFRWARHNLRFAALFTRGRWRRRGRLCANCDELARRSFSASKTLARSRAVYARRASRRRAGLFLSVARWRKLTGGGRPW